MTEPETRSRIIANPSAAADPALADAVQRMEREGHRIEITPTQRAGDGARLCHDALQHGVTRIVAAGGDGLLGEVANALLADGRWAAAAQRAVLGVLPYGTANDFARANGLECDDAATGLAVALENQPRRIDIVRCNERYFINSCTAGFGAKVTSDTQSGFKSLLGGASYLLSALTRVSELEPYRLDIDGDALSWQGEAFGFALTNGRQAGGGILISPEALLDDGHFDGLLFPAMTLSAAVYLLQQLATGERPTPSEDIVSLRGNSLRIRADRPLPITLDGEPLEVRQLELELYPQRLAMALPADTPLLGQGRGGV